ncbi:hypothetical protein GCK72_022757 [Caenorhabditis remanei]|uniref:Uncharacterized protein n=1 Tax=Caenorhabditis remanei TaxID=31234 RepID=A0A6A5FUT4_CAERE|nr:hypothetical protein GCK72_022757 [Caenorhabditis remanei]KAF1746304.1 hypothetical protein GCK72_022757 [Caenorhabditis remanei]
MRSYTPRSTPSYPFFFLPRSSSVPHLQYVHPFDDDPIADSLTELEDFRLDYDVGTFFFLLHDSNRRMKFETIRVDGDQFECDPSIGLISNPDVERLTDVKRCIEFDDFIWIRCELSWHCPSRILKLSISQLSVS